MNDTPFPAPHPEDRIHEDEIIGYTALVFSSSPSDPVMGFDPSDYESWPYGIDSHHLYDRLIFDPITEDEAPCLDLFEVLAEITNEPEWDISVSNARVMEMALRLFLHLASDRVRTKRAFDPRVNGLSHYDVFAACLHTALIWEGRIS